MADNPTWQHNDGMQGYKGSVHEGGHRVPFFISYPNGDLKAGDYKQLTAHVDIMPTLLALAGIEHTIEHADGKSLAKLITQGNDNTLADRSVIVTNQRVYHPSADRPTMVAKNQWRYIEQGKKAYLYNIETDPGQQKNIIKQHPDIATSLKAEKLAWWNENVELGFGNHGCAICTGVLDQKCGIRF